MSIENPINNKEASEAEFFEYHLGQGAEDLDHQIEAIKNRLDNIEQTDPERGRRLKEKFRKKLGQFVVGFSTALSLTAIGLTLNYERTRYDVQEVKSKDSVQYLHEDQETTEIIEVLSGKRSLDKETQFKLVKAWFINWFNASKFDYPAGLEDMSEEEFKKAASEVLSGDEFLKYTRNILAREDWMDNFVPGKINLNEAVYSALWDIEILSNNPRIRWGMNNWFFKMRSGQGAYYNPLTNTMYISSPTLSFMGTPDLPTVQSYPAIDDYISESSHAVQFNTHPISTLVNDLKANITGLKYYVTTNVKDIYSITYKIPGTIEGDAHGAIEPKLKKRFSEKVQSYDKMNTGRQDN